MTCALDRVHVKIDANLNLNTKLHLDSRLLPAVRSIQTVTASPESDCWTIEINLMTQLTLTTLPPQFPVQLYFQHKNITQFFNQEISWSLS